MLPDGCHIHLFGFEGIFLFRQQEHECRKHGKECHSTQNITPVNLQVEEQPHQKGHHDDTDGPEAVSEIDVPAGLIIFVKILQNRGAESFNDPFTESRYCQCQKDDAV